MLNNQWLLLLFFKNYKFKNIKLIFIKEYKYNISMLFRNHFILFFFTYFELVPRDSNVQNELHFFIFILYILP